MTSDPEKHHRRSIRLKDYDYAHAGAYFVTIVTRKRKCLFGEIDHGDMKQNPAGQMTEKWWAELSSKFPAVELDTYVVMPNHFHGIVVIVDQTQAGLDGSRDLGEDTGAPLPTIVQWFKTMTTNEYIRSVKALGWQPFSGKLWQRNYHEHVVRDENDLAHIRQYIDTNPQQWALDDENPDRLG